MPVRCQVSNDNDCLRGEYRLTLEFRVRDSSRQEPAHAPADRLKIHIVTDLGTLSMFCSSGGSQCRESPHCAGCRTRPCGRASGAERAISGSDLETDLVRHDDVRRELCARRTTFASASVSRLAHSVSASKCGLRTSHRDAGRTLDHGVDSMDVLHTVGCALYDDLALDQPRIRLVGLKCERLIEQRQAHEQLALFGKPRNASVRKGTGAGSRFGGRRQMPGLATVLLCELRCYGLAFDRDKLVSAHNHVQRQVRTSLCGEQFAVARRFRFASRPVARMLE